MVLFNHYDHPFAYRPVPTRHCMRWMGDLNSPGKSLTSSRSMNFTQAAKAASGVPSDRIITMLWVAFTEHFCAVCPRPCMEENVLTLSLTYRYVCHRRTDSECSCNTLLPSPLMCLFFTCIKQNPKHYSKLWHWILLLRLRT